MSNDVMLEKKFFAQNHANLNSCPQWFVLPNRTMQMMKRQRTALTFMMWNKAFLRVRFGGHGRRKANMK